MAFYYYFISYRVLYLFQLSCALYRALHSRRTISSSDPLLSLQENNYYHAYLELILATENLNEFFKIYNKLVPHVAIPEPSVMLAILETLGCYPAEIATQYIPKIWSHMVMFGHLDRGGLLECLLNLISVHCKPTADSPLNTQFAEIALAIWDHIQVIELFLDSNSTGCLRHTFHPYELYTNQYIYDHKTSCIF